jgi:hypothetical protein
MYRLILKAGASSSLSRGSCIPLLERRAISLKALTNVFSKRTFLSTSSNAFASSSPFDPQNLNTSNISPNKRKRRSFVPRKAAVQLTEKARHFFKLLLESPPRKEVIGIMLNFDQSKSGEPRMVFSFSFVAADEIDCEQDEGVSLELIQSIDANGEEFLAPKPPEESRLDGLPKLYVHHNAFLKVLGATIDVDTETITPILYDPEGNRMDPSA